MSKSLFYEHGLYFLLPEHTLVHTVQGVHAANQHNLTGDMMWSGYFPNDIWVSSEENLRYMSYEFKIGNE